MLPPRLGTSIAYSAVPRLGTALKIVSWWKNISPSGSEPIGLPSTRMLEISIIASSTVRAFSGRSPLGRGRVPMAPNAWAKRSCCSWVRSGARNSSTMWSRHAALSASAVAGSTGAAMSSPTISAPSASDSFLISKLCTPPLRRRAGGAMMAPAMPARNRAQPRRASSPAMVMIPARMTAPPTQTQISGNSAKTMKPMAAEKISRVNSKGSTTVASAAR